MIKQLPRVESNCNRIIEIFYQAVSSRLLIVAIEMKIFDHLENFITSSDLAGVLSLHVENTSYLLDALCACGLVEKSKGLYKNISEVNDLLVTGKPAYLGHWLKLANEDLRSSLDNLPELIVAGPGLMPDKDHMNSESYCEEFTTSHAASSLAGIARDIAKEIITISEFENCHNFLDLGGGPGINAMTVVEASSHSVKATVLDRPNIIKFTEKYIQQYGFDEQVIAKSGDYLEDSIGTNYDMIMITDSLYYSESENEAVIKKCRAALNSGGFLVGIHAVLTHERTRPSTLVLGMFPDAVKDSGQLPDQGFLEKTLVRCGFENLSSKMISVGGSPMEMNVGYKI